MNRHRFAFKREDELWTMEETREITQEDWGRFVKEMHTLTSALKDFGKPFGFKVMGTAKKGCLFE